MFEMFLEERPVLTKEKKAEAWEKKAMAKLLADKNKLMMMNLTIMDTITREWWEGARKAILE
jgi:hypothetical protein